jgi:hypothetical protein
VTRTSNENYQLNSRFSGVLIEPDECDTKKNNPIYIPLFNINAKFVPALGKKVPAKMCGQKSQMHYTKSGCPETISGFTFLLVKGTQNHTF